MNTILVVKAIMDDILLHCMDTFQQFLDVHAFLKKMRRRGGGGWSVNSVFSISACMIKCGNII